jgi:hypothetical protein
MKFCVIKRNDGKLYGKEYEEPYRYSTYTAGGGDWWNTFVPQDALTIGSKTGSFDTVEYMVAIYESREEADKDLKKLTEHNIFRARVSDEYEYEVVNLGEL